MKGSAPNGATHRSTAMTALPYLDLSIDKHGTLYVEPPKWTTFENGVIGNGRSISLDEIRNNSEFLVESFAKSYPNYPPIPAEFAGYALSEISPEKHSTTVRYLDFQSKSGSIVMTVRTNGMIHSNFEKSSFENWQIGDTIIRISGSAMDENSDLPESFRYYEFNFSDGHNCKITGKNLEFIKKEIVANFFPEYSYDDLFLVSSMAGQ